MNETTFRDYNEFKHILLSGVHEHIPNADIYFRKGGDNAQDILLEIIIGDKSMQFYPYDLYKDALPGDRYDEVVADFIKECKEL